MPGKYEIKKAKNGQFHFNLKAGNGEVILSSELYTTKDSAQQGIDSVKANAALDARYERMTAKDGSPYFLLKADNGEVIGKSEMYSAPAAMENGIQSVKTNGPESPVHDLSDA